MSERDERLDTLLALHLDALEPEEAARVRARVAQDAGWRADDEEARKMVAILGMAARAPEPPVDLAQRTAAALAAERPAPFLSLRLAAAILALAAVPALWLASQWLLAGPAGTAILWKPAETVASGGWFGPRVVVRDTGSGEPIEGATLRAFLLPKDGEPIALGEGTTDASGMLATGGFRLPDLPPGEARLAIETEGAPRVEAPVLVTAEARLAVSPDRRRVRPGESVRVRALLVTTDGARPLAGRDVELSLSDPRGNRVGLEKVLTSRFGLAWTEFPIDSEAIEGDWTLDARAVGQVHVSTVTVRRDVLPAYRVTVRPSSRWVKPGETFEAEISARTFDGGVVRDLSVEVIVGGLGGTKATLKDGSATVSLKAPEDTGPVRIEARVTDAAGREGAGMATVTAAKDAARVIVLPEAGELVPGVSNRVYLVGRRADGGPAGSIEAKRGGAAVALTTDAQGVAVMTIFKPRAPAEVISLRAGADGTWTDVALDVRSPAAPEAPSDTAGSLLLRTDRALVEAGGALAVEAFSSRDGLVAFDLRLDGRSIAVAGAELRGGVARAKLTVPGGIAGLLTLHASMPGSAWADRRVVLVRGSRDLRVSVAADRERYRPGETASLACSVTDGDGRGVPAALSLVAVDEALLALTGDQGGLVQAWHEQAGRALRRPDSDLDPDAIDDGSTPLAQATAAALRPVTVAEVIAQLKDILPMSEMGSYGDRLARLFEGNDLGAEELRRRDTIVEQLRQMGHTATADALLQLTAMRQQARTQGWQDTAPGQRAAAVAERSQVADRLLVAAALLSVVAAVVLLLRQRIAAELLLATLTLVWTGVGIALIPIAEDRHGLAPWAVLQAIVLAAQLRVALSIRGGSRGLQIGLVGFVHLLLALVLASGEPALSLLGIPILLVVAAMQSNKRQAVGCAIAGTVSVVVVFGAMVTLIPKSQEKSFRMEAMNDARQVAAMLEERDRRSNLTEMGAEAPGSWAGGRSSGPPARLREDFRETLLFAPEVVTDENGRATVEVPLADSLTGWRILADAIALKGGVAESRTRIDVSMPLSADLRLPGGGVVEGDEMEVRVVVSNHTSEARRLAVDLDVTGAERLDAGARTVDLLPNAVAPADFRVRFAQPGEATLRVTLGDVDRVERTVLVHRNARRVEFGETRRVSGGATFSVRRPERVTDVRGEIRVERGAIAPALEGLDAMLKEPHGCFEQTSSIHYPNVLVLRQLSLKPGADPAALRRARDLVARGYQRLLGFEVERSGLFSLYGKPPGNLWLTAYGLLQFRTMEGVHPVDPNLLARIEQALLSRRQPDGSFAGGFGGVHPDIERPAALDIAQTAYVALALGRRAPAETCAWLLARRERIESDPYLCALVSYALGSVEPAAAAQFASKLPALAARGKEGAFLSAETTLGWGGSRGGGISVEATALGALALLGSGDQGLAQELLDSVVKARMPRGDWGSTHATAWALLALEEAAGAARGPAPRTIVEAGGRAFELLDEASRAPFAFEEAETQVRARVDGGAALVTLRGRGWTPWDAEAEGARGPEVRVEWDRTDLAPGETALATIRLTAGPDGAKVPMIAWGLFAGASPVEADLEKLRADGRIERFERSGNEVRLYLADVPAGQTVQLAVRLTATARGTFTATPSRAWEYYRPDAMTTLRPARFTVR